MSGVAATTFIAPAKIEPLPLETSAPQRLYALDAIRALAMFLVIGVHGAIPYIMPPRPEWHADPWYHSQVFSVGVLLTQLFAMPAFFTMAGFFSRLSYYRHGPRKFMRGRVKHLLIPFLVLWPILAVLSIWLSSYPVPMRWPRKLLIGFCLLYHLWFLVYLLTITVGAVLWHRWVDPIIRARWKRFVDREIRLTFRTPLAILACALFTVWPLMLMKTPFVDTPPTWIPNFGLLFYYGMFFTFGWLIQRQPERLEDIRRWRWVSYVAIVVLFVVVVLAQKHELPLNWVRRPILAVFVWSLTFGLFGLFLHNLGRPNPAVRFLADASFWCYLMHLPLELWYEKKIRYVEMYGPLKFVLIMAGTIVPLLLLYPLVRRTIIGEYLGTSRSKKSPPAKESPPEPVIEAAAPMPAAAELSS